MPEETISLLFGDTTQRIAKVLKTFEKTTTDLEQDINILREWIRSQAHLPEIPCDAFLRNIIFMNKFSIEKAKQHIDAYYSLRAVIPEIFAERSYRRPSIRLASETVCYVGFPKLTDEGYRISITKLEHGNPDDFSLYHCVAYIQNFIEIRMLTDLMLGDIFINDMSLYTFGHISKMTPIHMKKMFMVIERVANAQHVFQAKVVFNKEIYYSLNEFYEDQEKVYKNATKQIHFINVSTIVENLILLIKQVVSKKLSERIFAHSSTEGLHKYVPKDLLPKEYGGSEYTVAELKEKWNSLLEKHDSRLVELENLKTDESKRPTPLVNDEVLGFYGNFKKLSVD